MPGWATLEHIWGTSGHSPSAFPWVSQCTHVSVINCMYDMYMGAVCGEIPVFLACPDVDPMHSPKIGYSLCSQ